MVFIVWFFFIMPHHAQGVFNGWHLHVLFESNMLNMFFL
jgi:hypothetical protein